MNVLRACLALAPFALAACQPADPDGYSDRYRPSQLDRVASANLLDASPEEIARARARDRAVYEAELERQLVLAGSLGGLQGVRRDALVGRQAQRASRAERDLVWASRARAQAARELRTAERLDRRPVFTNPTDRLDAERRLEQVEAARALDRQQRAARVAARASDRVDRLGDVDSAADRLRIMDRIERREADRDRAARQGPPDPLERYLPYRRQGESAEALRDRVDAARSRSAATGEPVESLLRESTD
jgi:hypothetical protein